MALGDLDALPGLFSQPSAVAAGAPPGADPAARSGIARALQVSPRTLQHHLAAAGTTFQRELDCVRVDVALRYLRATDEPIACITARVGFGASAAFTRFLRAATGAPPRVHREVRSSGEYEGCRPRRTEH